MKRTPLPRKTRMKPVSAKRKAYRQSDEGKAGLAHMARVRALPCVGCGKPRPNEAHHCRDLPDFGQRGLYERLPGAGIKSSDLDTIPLCPTDHRLFHENRAEFHRRYGRDYEHIAPTRWAVENMEIDF